MSAIRHTDLIPEEGKSFEKCKLGREKYADVLTSIVSTYADGFVLAINNEWGAGKTTFVKMWQQKLEDNYFQTLYFNAWENDFDTNPLVALMAELKELVKVDNAATFKTVVSKGAGLVKKIGPHLAKHFVTKYGGEEVWAELAGDSAEAVADILDDEIKDFASKKKGLKEFRTSLTKFVNETKGDKPLVFIIDELDRCRPSYAVELLEQIKHFFSVPGIVFVLSIDKVQLGNAVRGFYGNDRIDAGKYLQRFIDLEFTLPLPDIKQYANYLYQYFGFDKFFSSQERRQHQEVREDGDMFLRTAVSLLEKSNLTLRDYEKVFSHSRIGLKSFRINGFVMPRVYFLLTLIRLHYPELFKAIKNKTVNFQELILELRQVFPKEISSEEMRTHIALEAQIVWMYSNSYSTHKYTKLFEKEEATGQEQVTVKSAIDNSPNGGDFIRLLKLNAQGFHTSDVGLDYLINKVDLLDQLSNTV